MTMPDQVLAFPEPTPFDPEPLGVSMHVRLARLPKAKRCASCGLRRVLIRLESNTGDVSPAICLPCAKIR
jgi:hypothetical protein